MGNEIDVVVSGGSIEGICDAAGFIHALTKDLGFTITSGAGASAGGIILGAYAAGHDADDIIKTILDIDFTRFISIPSWWNFWRIYRALRRGWLSDGECVLRFFEQLTKRKTIAQSRFDIHIAGTDVCHYTVHDFNKQTDPNMSLAMAMRITSCVPGCFKPQAFDEHYWYDGSVRSHYPTEMVPQSNRPFFGFLASYADNAYSDSVYGTLSRLIDNTLDINMRYSEHVSKRRPITITHDGYRHHGWSASKSDRKRLIENARIATIKKIDNLIDHRA